MSGQKVTWSKSDQIKKRTTYYVKTESKNLPKNRKTRDLAAINAQVAFQKSFQDLKKVNYFSKIRLFQLPIFCSLVGNWYLLIPKSRTY